MKEANSPEEIKRAVKFIVDSRKGNSSQSRKSKMLKVDHYLDELEMAAIEAGECDSDGAYLTDVKGTIATRKIEGY